MYTEGSVIINSIDEYRDCLKRFNCKTLNELEDVLWYEYGISLEVKSSIRNSLALNE